MKRTLPVLLLISLLIPTASVQAAYPVARGQSVLINKPNNAPATVTISLATLSTTSQRTFAISIFGSDYTLDLSRSEFVNADRSSTTSDRFRPGDKVNVIGLLDATDATLIRASLVRNMGTSTDAGGGDQIRCNGPAALRIAGPGTLKIRQDGTYTASGGNGTYRWSSIGGESTRPTYTVRFGNEGRKMITITSGSLVKNCFVMVTNSTSTSEIGLVDEMFEHAKNPSYKSTAPVVLNQRWKQPTLANWNRFGGSQNLPLIAEAAVGNYKIFADLARLERSEGLYGKEFGSPGFYFSTPFVSKMVALRDARLAGDTAAADEIAKEMEAILALWSLVAVQTPRTSETVVEAGRVITGPGNGADRAGISVAAAGNRWHGHFIAADDIGMILSWAVGVTPSPRPTRLKTGGGKWWNNAIGWLGNVDGYSQPTDPAIWGLTADSRSKILSLVRGETTHLQWALSLIREYGVWKDSPVRLRRTSEGVETVWFRASNGNKPAEAVTSMTNGGVWKSMRPCSGPGVGANGGYQVTISGGVVSANGNPPHCAPSTQAELGGNIIYEVMIRGKSVTLGNNQPLPTGDPQDTPPPDEDPGDDDGGGNGGGGGGGGVGRCDAGPCVPLDE